MVAKFRIARISIRSSLCLLVMLAGAGCGSGEIEITGGEFLEQAFTPYCERAIDCFDGGGESVQECVNLVVNATCQDIGFDVCSETVVVNEDDLNRCIDDMSGLTCNEVDAGIVPASCLSIQESMQ